MNINIGGGRFSYPGWINLDAANGFKLAADSVFPVVDAPIVYSSHCLEHLDDATVDRVLSEARRICRDFLVLKLPDFEKVLRHREAQDETYFQGWGQNRLTHNWLADTVDARAAMIFCGYWDDAYGDEFLGKRNPAGYHGPVKLQQYDFSGTPHEIARRMVELAPSGAHFNHQNAWSRDELRALCERHGFKLLSEDRDAICTLPIPTISDLSEISMYAKFA